MASLRAAPLVALGVVLEACTSFALPPFPSDVQSFYQDGFLHVSKRIENGDTPLGSIYLRASTANLNASLRRNIQVAALSLFVCLVIAFAAWRVVG